MKNFVKAMDKHGKDFEYLREKFPETHWCCTERDYLLDCKLLKSLTLIHWITSWRNLRC
jgi:hypothetical protein